VLYRLDDVQFVEASPAPKTDLLPILTITELKEARPDAPLGAAIREWVELRGKLERACREDDMDEIRRLARILVGID
jgi:hypothetical protein